MKSASTYLDVFLQVLGTLKGLLADLTLVWLQWNMDSDMGSDMVSLDCCSPARVPATGQVEVVGALSSDVLLTDVFLEEVRGI